MELAQVDLCLGQILARGTLEKMECFLRVFWSAQTVTVDDSQPVECFPVPLTLVDR